jgi:cell division cycle protein 37
MVSGDKRASVVFVKDVEDTYNHLITRVKASQEAPPGGAEQIQLVPENPSQTISFNVPDGPPPENITLEGPGTEEMDIEEVRKALQMRWDVFDGFSDDLKEALKGGKLDAVNKCLGDMSVDEAEEVVRLLDIGGILSFAEGGIRDETGKDGEEDEVE